MCYSIIKFPKIIYSLETREEKRNKNETTKMKPLIRLFSLNAGKINIPGVINFLEKLKPDIICLQEAWESDFLTIKKCFGMKGLFAPETQKDFREDALGVVFLTNLSIKNMGNFCYAGNKKILPKFVEGDTTTVNWNFIYATIIEENSEFVVGTTHFIWTPDGKPNKLQRKGLKSFLKFLKGMPKIVFCGDFNAPRGGEVFNAIAKHYKDNIPSDYRSSIDPSRSGYSAWGKTTMVDGIFSTPHYDVKSVLFHSGLSDHCAITAEIETK